MGQTNLYAEKYAYVERGDAGNSHTNQLQLIGGTLNTPTFLLRFPALPNSLKFRKITAVGIEFGVSGNGQAGILKETFLSDDFDPETLIFDTIPTSENAVQLSIQMIVGVPAVGTAFETNIGKTLTGNGISVMQILQNRTCIFPSFYKYKVSGGATSAISIFTQLYSGGGQDQYRPHLVVSHSDADVGAEDLAMQGRDYINPHIANTLRWDYTLSQSVYEQLSVTYETFYWKEHGASTYQSISVTPGAKKVDIPAETFPAASSIDYYVRVVCNSGVTSDSAVVTSSTADTIPTATPETPKTTVEETDAQIVFSWNVANDSGSLPIKSELQYSTNNGTSWADLATILGSNTEYTAPADTFSAGSILWRVRAYNIDNVAGEWSSASFVALGAPPAPSILSDGLPFATITWQSSGQQAYQIEMDGEDLGTFFGTDKTYKVQTPLSDGSHTVRVRVQNEYGLWSQYGSSSFNVENVPGDAVELEGLFGADAVLSWITSSSTADFLIFRDGALIGHTTQHSFVDRVALGSRSYYVINRLANGNYSKSNTVSGVLKTDRPLIAPLQGGDWLPLQYSERSVAEQRFTWSKNHSLRHIAGANYPVLELSPYEDLNGTYDAAFLNRSDALPFQQLLGKIVIIKSREGKVLIGALTDYSEVVNTFYLAFQFTVEQIHWEDYIDDENA